ncbi:NUDIX domain-containing protein [Halomarina salina]|uniref:NUDIX domain-containing protein n=1 Tax=Halomarina salina TaxID=1872699 RepID=A0ABD5RKF6_9EURY|nr:NUDIX hydrolase [Halomarina salina]
MDDWPVTDTSVEYENPFFAVRRDSVEQADGTPGDYYYLDKPDDVTVVAVTEEGELVLVEQYRPRLRGTFLECPAGSTEGDDPLDAAARELREETGYRAGALEHVGSYYPSGWERSRQHVVVATDLEAGDPELHSGESDIEVHHRSVTEAFEYVRSTSAVAWLAMPLFLAREAGLL